MISFSVCEKLLGPSLGSLESLEAITVYHNKHLDHAYLSSINGTEILIQPADFKYGSGNKTWDICGARKQGSPQKLLGSCQKESGTNSRRFPLVKGDKAWFCQSSDITKSVANQILYSQCIKAHTARLNMFSCFKKKERKTFPKSSP